MTDSTNPDTHPPRGRQFVGGTRELGIGIWFLFFAFCIRLSFGIDSTWRWAVIVWICACALGFQTHFGLRYIRRRIIYPRSGYARIYPDYIAMILGACSLYGGWMWFLKFNKWLGPEFFISLVVGWVFVFLAAWNQVPRFYALGAFSIGIGALLKFIMPVPHLEASRWTRSVAITSQALFLVAYRYFLSMGFVLLVVGSIVLYLYAQRTPKQNLEIE